MIWLNGNRNQIKIRRLMEIREKALHLALRNISREMNRGRIEKINREISCLYEAGTEIESPIEQKLLDAMSIILKDRIDDGKCRIVPQFNVAGYRLDFALFDGGMKLGIECDGEAYHADAAKDKKRDREIVLAGFRVMRFTGAEIVNDPESCVIEVLKVIRYNEKVGKGA